MPETRSKRPKMNHNDRQVLTDSGRPTKRAKLTADYQENEEPIPIPHESQPINTFDEEDEQATPQPTEEVRASDLYLDTVSDPYFLCFCVFIVFQINRAILDFDFEKVCSVSLSNINIYGCLVCGKYFQGRGRKSYAYSHSIHEDHHVFINLETTKVWNVLGNQSWIQLIEIKVYVLPDGYPVSDPSLEDISYVLAPTFTRGSVATLSTPAHLTKPSYDLASKAYLPGYVGLNNIKRNDHMNVIIHSLLHIPPLRDFLLLSNFRGKESELLKRFAGLAKKLWNPRLFKSQVSPHEFLQEVNRASAGKFRLEQQGDPTEFLGWLLNRLHKDLGGSKKKNSSR
jgi:U4/U6.U5 tri-snRNP-associated protein 2